MKKPAIEFKDFSFQYRAQAKPTLNNINLTIYEGDQVLIVGPSGSGKSTLVNEILYKGLNKIVNKSKNPTGAYKEITGYENIDKILIETLKDKDKNIVGVQQSNTKFSYVDLYFNDKVTTIDNVDEGIGKLSLVMVLQDSSIAGKFGKLEGSDSIIPYKK